jgi:hypothetical protein
MTNTEDRSRRLEDQHPSEPLQWDTEKPPIAAVLSHLALKRTAGPHH